MRALWQKPGVRVLRMMLGLVDVDVDVEAERAGARQRIVRISRSLEVLYLSGCSFWPPVVRASKMCFAFCSLNAA